MARRASINVGNYAYTAQDAQKTLAYLDRTWSHHTHESQIPEGWLAGARGFLAEMCSLGGVALPSLENVDTAFACLTESLTAKYADLTDTQIESLLAAAWRFFPTMRLLSHEHTGTVAHMHASKGLPKKPIDRATIGWKGVEGDVQSARAHHGRPWQALCIWSTDAIDSLRAQGHPVAPAAHLAQNERARIAPRHLQRVGPLRIGRQARPLVQIAGIGHAGGQFGAQPVFVGRGKERRVAIDPDVVVMILQRLEIALAQPLLAVQRTKIAEASMLIQAVLATWIKRSSACQRKMCARASANSRSSGNNPQASYWAKPK